MKQNDNLKDAVFAILQKVPVGKVTTYGQLAEALGRPGAARAVGNALNKNKQLKIIPCHRVVKSKGELGGFVLGEQVKIKYLAEEGVAVENGRVVDFELNLYKF